MRRLIIFIIIICMGSMFCSVKSNRIETEVRFANKMAMAGLWKEATFRWQKVLAMGKKSAAIHNNLAIALEQMGKYKEAEEEYKKALALAPGNNLIKENYKKLQNVMAGKSNVKGEKKKKEGKERPDRERWHEPGPGGEE